jgi:DNA helicase-2/ATP-dependent DNA helicase PcrA
MSRDYTLHTSHGTGPKIDYQAELNPQQYAAVTCPPGQTLVIAGAGSGKTRTLTYRVAWLLANGILPEQILLLTFTNKAAREMVDRVAALVEAETHRLWGGTFTPSGTVCCATTRSGWGTGKASRSWTGKIRRICWKR